MNYEVKRETLENVLKYLSSRPFAEVAVLIKEIQESKPIGGPDLKEAEEKDAS